jgi:hypothetical protein
MPRLVLVAALCVEAGALAFIAYRIDPAAGSVQLFTAWVIAAAGALVALLAVRALRLRARWIIVAAVALRFVLVAAQPTLSDDVWRYLHDGRAQLAGVNPYAFAPADERTRPFRGAEHPRINHPHLVTIYPPAAQLAFALTALLGSSLFAWKLVVLAAELALLLAIAALLRQRARDPRLLAVYAWHPLAVLEIAGNGHMEPLALAPLLVALLFAARRRAIPAGAALALSAAAKYWAAPLLPLLARGRTRQVAGAAAATAALLYAPYLVGSASPMGSAGTFAREWESNAGVFLLLQQLTGSRAAALTCAAGLLAGVLLMLWRHCARPEDSAFAFVFATLLVAPVVHPWYLLWLAALLPVAAAPAGVLAAAAWWTLAAPAAYAVLPAYAATGVWQVPLAASAVQLAPVFGLLALAGCRPGFLRIPAAALAGGHEKGGGPR